MDNIHTSSTKPFDRLFDADRVDRSIWHAVPRGLHAFGLLAPPPDHEPAAAIEATDTTHSTDDRDGRTHRPPALAHGTIQAILADALMLWLENDTLDRFEFNRVDWRWHPTHVGGTWEAPGVRIGLRVAMIDGDSAVIVADITNTTDAPLEADLVCRGDDNYTTLCRNAAHGLTGEWAYAGDHTVVVTKHPAIAVEMECFPYTGALPVDDPGFSHIDVHYQFALAFDDQTWRQESEQGPRGFETWRMRRPVRIEPGATLSMSVGFTGYWSGRSDVPSDAASRLVVKAEAARGKAFDDVVAASRAMWTDLLDKAPVLKKDWPDAWVDLYYKAWVATWADLLPPGDLAYFTWKNPVVACLRIGDTGFANPASWEAALGALILSLADPALGCQCIEAVYETTEEDGYIAEALGMWRSTALACVEPWIAWACYRQSGDKEFLRRIWDNVRKNLRYRLFFPYFKHGTVCNGRNYAYGNISAKAALKIAKEIDRPAHEIEQVQRYVDETRRVVHAFWDERGGYHRASFDPNERANGRDAAFTDGTDADTLVALLGVASPDECKRMIDFIREQYITDVGALRRYPLTANAATSGHRTHLKSLSAFTVKESNHLAIFKGIKDQNRDLFETVARGTIALIANDGDFWEGSTLDGRGKHNGPGSIFGAFAVIWGLLLMEDQVDHLYD